MPSPNHNTDLYAPISFCANNDIWKRKEKCTESKILLSEHTGQSLLGCLLQLLICTGTAFGADSVWVCCQDQPFKAYLHFYFLHVTYLQGQERVNRCRNYSFKRKEMGRWPKPRQGAGMSWGEVGSRHQLELRQRIATLQGTAAWLSKRNLESYLGSNPRFCKL